VVEYLLRRFTCQQTVTHPSSNHAQCKATKLMETKVLTTTPQHHPLYYITHLQIRTLSLKTHTYIVIVIAPTISNAP